MKRCTSIFLAGENLSALCNKELRPTYRVPSVLLSYIAHSQDSGHAQSYCYANSCSDCSNITLDKPAYWCRLCMREREREGGLGLCVCVCVCVCVRERERAMINLQYKSQQQSTQTGNWKKKFIHCLFLENCSQSILPHLNSEYRQKIRKWHQNIHTFPHFLPIY